MKQRLIASALFALLALIAAIPAHAQSTAPVVLPNGCGTGNATNSLSYLTVDSTLKLCVNASVTANVGATAQAALPTVAPGSGAPLFESLSGGLFVQPIFGTTLVDGTHGLPTNCVSGCAGGTASNAGSGVATSSTNGQSIAWLYGFNGTTWDQLQVDASKNLKVAGAVTQSGTWTVQPGNTPNTTPWLANPTSQYPSGATPITASATGTTAATTATLAASASLKTYLCGFSIRANATAAATANSTVTGSVTGTLNYTQWTAPNASGIGLTEQIFTPCVPSSAVNTAVAVVSAAPGTGGVVSVTAWGYQGN